MHRVSNIFEHSLTTIGVFWVSLNYPIPNFKKTVCLKNVWMRLLWAKIMGKKLFRTRKMLLPQRSDSSMDFGLTLLPSKMLLIGILSQNGF